MKSEIKQRIDQFNNGEIPDGYKKTEFGVFPRDWETDKTFGDLFDFYGGLSKPRDELGEEGYAYLHYGDLHRSSSNCVSLEQYSQLPKCDITLNGKETCLMEDGDVAFLDASEDLKGTSRAVLIDNPDNDPFIAGLHIIYGKSKDDSLEKWYKQYITSLESVKKQFQRFAAGFKVYGVNRDTLPKIRIAYPPSLQEQSRIAEILMKWDEAIELQEQYTHILENRKRYIMKSVLAPKTDWHCEKLGKISNMYAGGTPSTEIAEYWNGDIPWIQSGLIQNNCIDIDDIDRRITEKGLNSSSTAWIRKDSVLVAITGATCANIAFLKCDATANQSVISITTDDLAPLFLYYYLQSVRNDLLSLQNGSAQGGLTLKYLENFDVSFPDFAKQNKLANVLFAVDKEIELHKKKQNMLNNQRKALQQYLLNGIVRV